MPRYVAVDVETTGLDSSRDRIIELACVDVSGLDATVAKSGVQYLLVRVNPGLPIPASATRKHGITDADVAGLGSFGSEAKGVLEFLKGATLVAHNAEFDKAFLVAEFARVGIDFKARTVCTLRKSRRLLTGLDSYKLEDLNKRYGLHDGRAHSALDDAVTAAKLNVLLDALEPASGRGSSNSGASKAAPEVGGTAKQGWLRRLLGF